MKYLLKLEELAMLLLSVLLLWNSNASWFWYLILLIGPDISMVGYLMGTRVGAALYNLFHHKGVAIMLFMLGIYLDHQLLQLVGVALFGHASLDRLLGLGLKYTKGFGFTHLDVIERSIKDLR